MEEPRIGVYICWCGTNIAMMVDVEDVAKEMQKIPNVVVAKDYKYMCSDPGQDLIIKDIKEHNLTRVVVAACSPRMHELTFRKALEKAGLNPYMFEMANIREQVSWVHTNRAEATIKSKDLSSAAIKRVGYHEALDKRYVNINPATLIIGGGIAGISAALEIANADKKVFLLERTDKLGGHVSHIDLTFPYFYDARQMIKQKIWEIKNNPNIELFLNSEVNEISGYVGNFKAIINNQSNGNKELEFGNTIAATGFKTFDAGKIPEYGYGKLPNVVTSSEFELMLRNGKIVTTKGNEPKNIAIIHCVGSRNKNHNEYCSRVCCMTALKYSNQIKSALPNSDIYEIYADMRTFGKGCEELYSETAKQGVMFLMFDQQNNLPVIKPAGENESCNLLIEMNERLSGEDIEVPADMVILVTGMEACEDAKEVSHKIGISTDKNGFFIEKHPKLDPVATTTDGVYIVGGCQGAKDIPDSVSQAKAAAARILASIAQGEVSVEVTTAAINSDICCGCQFCVSMCPYTAISFDEENGVSVVNEVLCKGCGTCGSTCPSGAIKSKHFTDTQIMSQIRGMLEPELSS
ncbi:MAG: CoB--CoM heterodisulfide reductase iron-sulfur subunit A family protein [Bacteroidetes bacterium]|nr:MAG: CoB--CoM heterodisulfide reductase iron-sulfur subunit A family protein [Bacteroidota bacterium]